MVHGPGDRRSYQSPEIVLAEARRMAAEIRRQAERDAAMLRRDAAEWASSIRRDAEARARSQTSTVVEAAPHAEPVVDLSTEDHVVDLRSDAADALAPGAPPDAATGATAGGAPAPDAISADDVIAALTAALRSVLPSPTSPPGAGSGPGRPDAGLADLDPAGVRAGGRAAPPEAAPGPTGEPSTGSPTDAVPIARPAETSGTSEASAATDSSEASDELDPYEIGRLVALGSWMDAAEFDGPSRKTPPRPTGVATERLERRSGDVIDLGRVVENRRRAAERRAEAAEQAERRAREGFRPVETSIETRVHDIVRMAVRRTFSRRSS